MSAHQPVPGVPRAVARADCRPDDVMPNAVVATLEGWLDEAGAEMLWTAAAPHLGSSTPWLLVDLSRVSLITSAGIGGLVRLQRRVQGLGGGMAVFGAGTRVREVIEVVRLDEILNLGPSIGDSRQRLRARLR